MLLIICIIAIGLLMASIYLIQKNSYIGIRIVCTILYVLSILRYITLFIFEKASSMELLIKMQSFYFITLIGITIPSLLLLWYMTPYFRKKINRFVLMFLCTPWLIYYLLLMMIKPYKITKSINLGYTVRLTGIWPRYLIILQLAFILIVIIGSLFGWKIYKHQQTRSQYMILIMCQLLFLLDGLMYLSLATPSIPVFTVTEIFGFLGIYYGFSKPPIDARGIKR